MYDAYWLHANGRLFKVAMDLREPPPFGTGMSFWSGYLLVFHSTDLVVLQATPNELQTNGGVTHVLYVRTT